MKLLCERFGSRVRFLDEIFERVRLSFLERPASNHFIAPRANLAAAELRQSFKVYVADFDMGHCENVIAAQRAGMPVRLPHARLWIEIGHNASYSYVQEATSIQFIGWLAPDKASPPMPTILGEIDPETGKYRFSDLLALPAEARVWRWAARAVQMLRVLNLPRLCHVERFTSREAKWKARGRFANTALPMISCNIVTLPLPGSPQFKGKVIETSHGGVRYHDVRGHWRLQDIKEEAGEMVPYFIWIDETHKGSKDKGVIFKTRKVVATLPAKSKRGFAYPTHVGTKGERIRAA